MPFMNSFSVAGGSGGSGTPGTPGSVWRDGTGAPSNGLGINGDYYLNDANGDVYLKASGTYSVVANIKGATGSTGATGATGPAGPSTVADDVFTLQDNGDATKQLRFQLSGITTGNTRVLTTPDADGVLVLAALAQTLTNKTLTSPVINSPTGIVKGDVGLGNVDNTSDATKNAAAVSLQNKTLDNTNTLDVKDTLFNLQDDGDATKKLKFQLSGITTANTRTMTVPDADGTLVLVALAQTLTNKTLTSPVINAPTGIVKGDVGLGNVDNTSDSTKNSATATLTNKAITPRVDRSTATNTTTWAPNADTTDLFGLASDGALSVAVTTISNPSGTPVDGQKLLIAYKSDGTPRALTWSGTKWRASTDLALPTTTIASKSAILGFIYYATADKWTLVAKLENI